MCARFFWPFIIAIYWEGAWSTFRVHSFMGSAPCECTKKKLNFGHWPCIGVHRLYDIKSLHTPTGYTFLTCVGVCVYVYTCKYIKGRLTICNCKVIKLSGPTRAQETGKTRCFTCRSIDTL